MATVVPWISSPTSAAPMPRRRQQLARAPDDRLGVVAGGGEDLPRERPPVRADQDQVGERAAHVDAQPIAHGDLPRPASPRGKKMTKTMITSPTAIRL